MKHTNYKSIRIFLLVQRNFIGKFDVLFGSCCCCKCDDDEFARKRHHIACMLFSRKKLKYLSQHTKRLKYSNKQKETRTHTHKIRCKICSII